jgi:hypothetical protein
VIEGQLVCSVTRASLRYAYQAAASSLLKGRSTCRSPTASRGGVNALVATHQLRD